MHEPETWRRYRDRVTASPLADAVPVPADPSVACRFCGGTAGDVVLDLGEQPSSELFPAADHPGPDPLLPLRMWLCAVCGLAQLIGADDVTEEPLGFEPAALARQRAAALERLAADAATIATVNRAWVGAHALFGPCVDAFVARLEQCTPGPGRTAIPTP